MFKFLFLLLGVFFATAQSAFMVEYDFIGKYNYNKPGMPQELIDFYKKNENKAIPYLLLYKDGKSVYKPAKEDQPEKLNYQEKDSVKDNKDYKKISYMEAKMPTSTYYTANNEKLQLLEKSELQYLVKKPKIQNIVYKEDTLKIENYTCHLAEIQTPKNIIKVWYTDEIPVSAGPDTFTDFPGLVLKVEGEFVLIYPKKITLKSIEEKEVSPPKNLEILTLEQYKQLP